MPALPPASETTQPPTPLFSVTAFATVADRLEAVLEEETEALRHNRACDLVDTCGRKRQGLLELTRFLPSLATAAERQDARARLGRLDATIVRNQETLDVRLGAVRQVADIIARTMRDAESDGTYSMLAGRS